MLKRLIILFVLCFISHLSWAGYGSCWGTYCRVDKTLNVGPEISGSGSSLKITYTATLANNVGIDLCAKNDNNYYSRSNYRMDFRFNTTDSILYRYFSPALYYSVNNGTWTQLASGWIASTIPTINKNASLRVRMILTLNPTAIFNADTIDLTNINLVNAQTNCTDDRYNVDRSQTMGLNEFQSTTFYMKSTAGSISLGKTCSLASATEQTVNLTPIFVGKLNSDTEVTGGEFPISLNCGSATANTAYISVTDANNTANTSQVLSLSSTSTAKGVGLKIYPSDSTTALTYGKSLSLPIIDTTGSNVSVFASSIAGTGMVTKNFTVKYVKNGTPTAGSVSAQMIYDIYYR
ncbi:fimbrial protein [Basilea psittacipulmonis]|uniref:Fimbrial-type adhesion domain-containing protein n=1 Tax=Basilea psittacipulmonis DSM 24701 TaxID=1072685 RepID=A0A077DEY3_9BURK|nr:fimbrial protein [Basilea psittacipulmonis]AIL31987.1 hypothetical protein IX83_00405 [Basilea psittacipulmonis DSM 24701]